MLTCQLEGYERLAGGTPSDTEKIVEFLARCNINLPMQAIDPADFVLFCEDDEVLGTIRIKTVDQTGQLSCIGVSNHFRFDDVLRRLLSEVVSFSKANSVRQLVVKTDLCQSWVLISPVFSQLGFTHKEGDATWHLTVQL